MGDLGGGVGRVVEYEEEGGLLVLGCWDNW